jgi:hypothetical protein
MSDMPLLAFCAAAAGLAVVPGPTIAVIIANTLRGGMRAGPFNTLGAQLGIGLWLLLAGWGMEAVLRHLGLWFDLLRYAAAAYMIWLALRLLVANGRMVPADRGTAERASGSGNDRSAAGLCLQGFVVTLTNPKMIMVFRRPDPLFPDGGGPGGAGGVDAGPDLCRAGCTQRHWLSLGGSAGARLVFARPYPGDRKDQRGVSDSGRVLDGALWRQLTGRAARRVRVESPGN